MRESELADLLIRMASERGINVEAAAEELAASALPSFVDARGFRSAVIQAVEASLRAQVEERLQLIRRRFDVEPVSKPVPTPRPVVTPPVFNATPEVRRSPDPMDGLPAPADATMTDLTPVADSTAQEPAAVAEEELPTDATMVWTTRHG